jgi:hypothetical protein
VVVFVVAAEHSAWGSEELHEELAEFDDFLAPTVLAAVVLLHVGSSVAVLVGTGWAESGTVEGKLAAAAHSSVVATAGLVEAQRRNVALALDCHAAQVVLEQTEPVAKHVAHVHIAARARWRWDQQRASREAA